MDVPSYRLRNWLHKMRDRLTHPWPMWKKVGGIDAVVIRADGKREDLGRVSVTYAKRKGWGVGVG